MRGERRLRESAGTSWGSRPVASVVWAETRVPPALGVWAAAGVPRASAPRVRPPALRSSRRVRASGVEDSGVVVMRSSSCGRWLLGTGIEDVAEAVADQVEGEHGDHDGDAGKHGDPRGGLEIGPPLVEHVAPRRRTY